ncbi:MAG: ATP-binding cassette domain-containing protein, partial [Gemmobacter sp.]
LALDAGPASGKRVIEAEGIWKDFGAGPVVRDLSLRVMRGDRVALVGPNGSGKTTLLRMLTGDLPPDRGRVVLGTGLNLAVFDQSRAQLDPEASLWESLTGDPGMRVSGRADQVMVRGQPRHVVAYLKDFLFDETRARAPVRSLSGGEKARLLLARIMARASNLLVLDEPTNDLDVETLDLLQDLLGEYDGTVLLVSHDRDFIDRVASVTVAHEGGGRWTVYAGGWSDMQAQRRGADPVPDPTPRRAAPSAPPPPGADRPRMSRTGLSFTERHRLEVLPNEIERLEAEIARLSEILSDPGLYARDPARFGRATEALTSRQAALAAAEEEWLALAERAEG